MACCNHNKDKGLKIKPVLSPAEEREKLYNYGMSSLCLFVVILIVGFFSHGMGYKSGQIDRHEGIMNYKKDSHGHWEKIGPNERR